MTNPFKNAYYYTKSDRRAIFAVGGFAIFAIGVMFIVDAIDRLDRRREDFTSEKQALQEISKQRKKEQYEKNGYPMTIKTDALTPFDPNTVDSLTLIRFGLLSWKVKNFLHYRASGKVFHRPEDLASTYGWSEEEVAMLLPYVTIGSQYQRQEESSWKERKETSRFEDNEMNMNKNGRTQSSASSSTHVYSKFQSLTKVDVNTADTTLLRRIPGVGDYISKAIVRYRERLGGFYSVEQLSEVKVVSPELLKWFSVPHPSSVDKININKASFQALNSHPYISYEQTKALLQYIRLYGKIEDEHALLSTGIFTADEIKKLSPYLAY